MYIFNGPLNSYNKSLVFGIIIIIGQSIFSTKFELRSRCTVYIPKNHFQIEKKLATDLYRQAGFPIFLPYRGHFEKKKQKTYGAE